MHGNVSFIELGTSDTERSRPFFQRVFGWTFTPMAQGGGWFQAPSMRVGFHGEDTPQIYVFFEVPDLEQAIALVREAGGEADPPAPEEDGIRSNGLLPGPARHTLRPSPASRRLKTARSGTFKGL